MLARMLILSGLIAVTLPVHAADATAGKAKSEACATCHGDNGKDDPPIAGMHEAAFTAAMKDIRSGARAVKNKKMAKAAKDLSDGDIADLAAYYSSLK